MKDKIGIFLLHRPTQQELKTGGIIPEEEAGSETAQPKKRSIFGRQDSKNAMQVPGAASAKPGEATSTVSTNLTNKSIRDKINWDYLGKKLPDDYPTITATYVTEQDVLTHPTFISPLLTPAFLL